MGRKTPLYEEHVRLNALMVEFGGWDMPLHYGSQIEEHHQVRSDAGVFDVSHMGVVDIQGKKTQAFLRHLLANNIDKLKTTGRALYGCMLNDKGGIIDDLITYCIHPEHYRLVVNAATKKTDLDWIKEKAKIFEQEGSNGSNELKGKELQSLKIEEKTDCSILAIQGPKALDKLSKAFPAIKEKVHSLKRFHFVQHNTWFIARTGYTGEDGVEIILPNAEVKSVWEQCLSFNIKPCGLGARDTLRLEAGLNLYGQDMDETVTPLESNLGWTLPFMRNKNENTSKEDTSNEDTGNEGTSHAVQFASTSKKEFIGQKALEMQMKQGVKRKLVGLVLNDKGVLRHHQALFSKTDPKKRIGEITSGTFSPTLKESIGLARIDSSIENECWVEIRGKYLTAKIVEPPFVRRETNDG